jgi:hypothetical protein
MYGRSIAAPQLAQAQKLPRIRFFLLFARHRPNLVQLRCGTS